MALTSERCFVPIFFGPTSWILLKQLFLEPEWAMSHYNPPINFHVILLATLRHVA